MCVCIITRSPIRRFSNPPSRGTSLVPKNREHMTSRSVERLQASVPGSDKNAPKQITIPVNTNGSIFHLCPYTKSVLCAFTFVHELTAVCTRDRKCACVRYICMYRSAAHCHDPLEICAYMREDCACGRAYPTREIDTFAVCASRIFVRGLRVHMWKHEKRAKWTVTRGDHRRT